MKLVSPVLKNVIYPALAGAGYLRWRAGGGELCVLTYHGVRPAGYVSLDPVLDGGLVSVENLRNQLKMIKRRYHVITPEQFLRWIRNHEPLPPLSILLTCDDGLQNVLTDMLPILQEADLRCMFFITGMSAQSDRSMLWYEKLHLLLNDAPPGTINIEEEDFRAVCSEFGNRRAFWWDLVKDLSARDAAFRARILGALHRRFTAGSARIAELHRKECERRRFLLLTVEEVQKLSNQGMTIGAHTVHHPYLSRVSDACAQAEIAGCRQSLQAALGCEIWALAYPFGDGGSITAREMTLAQAANFSCAFMNCGGGFGADLPMFALPRVHVTADMSVAELEAHISGFYRSLHRASNFSASVAP